MIEPELRLLKYFVVVAEELHFGRAAERLRMAQPPLSQQIRKLEKHLGVELIDRTSRPIALTDAGRAVFEQARLAMSYAERAVAAGHRAALGQLGSIRIGALQAAVDGILPHVLREYHKGFPDVDVNVTELRTPEQIAQIADHRLDLGLLRGPVDEHSLAIETLIDDSLAAVLPEGHPLAANTIVHPKELAQEALIVWARVAAPTTFADIVELFRQHSMQPNITQECQRIQTILAFVASGLGVSLLPASFATLGRSGVRFVQLAPPVPYRPLALAWRSDDSSASLAGFIAACRVAAPGYLDELGDKLARP